MPQDSQRYSAANLVRDFLDYFAARGHDVVPSAPLLPDDPTLLFTAAGMVPFKGYFSDPASAPYARAASVQKCLRAGGKQSDLENVGRTLRHHTFFEMLGNFSFGDYFKKEAIEWGWDLSVEIWKMDPARMWVSVFEEDDEAFELWEKHIGFPRDRIVRMGRADNFWGPVGDTGICGPSSEMYYDSGRPGKEGGPAVESGDRYIEYWNLVFPQFFYTAGGKYDLLPRPGIDTGLGLERLAVILQGVEDNFHTDEFLPIRTAVAKSVGDGAREEAAQLAINAAADHVRALTFALAEGIVPSNEGRGYVLRRLLRRALTKLQPFGVREPFLADAVDAVVRTMSPRYPELTARAALVKEMVTAEEERFISTLEQGMGRLERVLDEARGSRSRVVPGAEVFMLYDTFGFPPELTEEFALDAGLGIDRDGFQSSMQAQKERSGGAIGVAGTTNGEKFITIGDFKRSEFVGYDALSCDASAAGLRRARGATTDDQYIEFTTDRTVFYPEGGGQVGDAGRARFGDTELNVVDTFRVGDRIAHRASWTSAGDPEEIFQAHPGGRLDVDRERRLATARNHTATHLLHAALRSVLGDHVAQAGSLVAPDRFRFDFHHFQAMKPEEVAEVEHIVTEAIMADMSVTAQSMPYKEAIATGAMALFGEKYGDTVRVVSVEDFSRELCGGTHLAHTGEIGPFFIRQEGAVGAGIRRVEALTGAGAFRFAKALVAERNSIAALLKVAPEDIDKRVRTLLDDVDAMQKQLRRDESRQARDSAGDALSAAITIGDVTFVAAKVEAGDVPSLRRYGDALREKLQTGVAVISQSQADKPVCLIVVSDRAVSEKSISAADITREISKALSFRGGGKKHMAQIGLGNIEDFDRVADFVKETLKSLT